jgi:hypothetical protein
MWVFVACVVFRCVGISENDVQKNLLCNWSANFFKEQVAAWEKAKTLSNWTVAKALHGASHCNIRALKLLAAQKIKQSRAKRQPIAQTRKIFLCDRMGGGLRPFIFFSDLHLNFNCYYLHAPAENLAVIDYALFGAFVESAACTAK